MKDKIIINTENIDKTFIDWNKFKSNAKGKNMERAKIAYINLIKLLKKNNHELLSEYVNNKTKVLIDYNCGHEPHWITPTNYKNGHSCPKCNVKFPIQAKEDFINIIKKNNHELLSEYVNNKTKVLIDYNCEHDPHWIAPYSYKNGTRCPKCSRNCLTQAKEDFMNILEESNHELLSEYVNTTTKVLIDYNCGHDPHWIRPDDYKRGNRCPLCKNKGEAALHSLILDMGHIVESQKTYQDLKDKSLLRYDFYLPEFNLLIELDGDHHREIVTYGNKENDKINATLILKDRKYKDNLKNNYAKLNNIPLLRIEYSNGKIELDKWKDLIIDKIEQIKMQEFLSRA